MEIISLIWDQYLYIPLFNLLIYLYTTYAFFNMGLAVIILTVILRVVLLPLTIMDEKAKVVRQQITEKIDEIGSDFAGDPVKRKIAIRQYLRQKKVRPWAKTLVLLFQALVLVLLYQVFIGGINTTEKIHLLYATTPHVDYIETQFLWFRIDQINLLMASIVAGYIFAEILINLYERRKEKDQEPATRRELFYIIFFPASVFLILAILPSVKSIFILTSLIFSTIISILTKLITGARKTSEKQAQSPNQ